LPDRVVYDALIQKLKSFKPVILEFFSVLFVQNLKLLSILLFIVIVHRCVIAGYVLIGGSDGVFRLSHKSRPSCILLVSELLVFDSHCTQLIEHIDEYKLAND